MNKKIIIDCDNTMGVKGCDIDDGLAILYLLGKENIEVCGITTTYGNSDVDTVYSNTKRMLKDIDRTDIKLFKGCPDRDILHSEAVDFLVETVNNCKNEVSILATGSLTNIFAAYLKEKSIFQKINEIVIMGGTTQELFINGKLVEELNLSCDPFASKCVLERGKNISIITGNNCLEAFFSHGEFVNRLLHSNKPSSKYIINKCEYWFEDMMKMFNINGFYNWDVVAAAYIAEPSLFINEYKYIKTDRKNIEKGFLSETSEDGSSCFVNIPSIKKTEEFIDEVFCSWLKARFGSSFVIQ